MKIARVFARQTNMTPTDEHAYYDVPGLFTPKYDTVYISCTFTYDKPKAETLARAWHNYGNIIIGGPAYGDPGREFTPGMFLKEGVTITSRGCPSKCGFCYVPKREGNIREYDIKPGNIIQDNNLLACSDKHLSAAFDMFKTQRAIDFTGGLDCTRINDSNVKELSKLKIYQIWVAYDDIKKQSAFEKAVLKLRQVFNRDKVRTYVLIGFPGDTLESANERLKFAYNVGTLPFAMKFRNDNGCTNKERAWNLLAREWTRPAIMKSIMKSEVKV